MRQKGQILMFNDIELSLIKNSFSDNEDLIYAIRKVLLQFELTKDEKKILKQAMTPELYAVVKKRIFPELDPDAPLFQLSDMYQSLAGELSKKEAGEMREQFQAKQIEIDYLTQQFEVLKDIDKKVEQKTKLADLASIDMEDTTQTYINLTARNYLLSYVDSFLNHLKVLAGQKTETIEETKKKLIRDSNK